MRIEGGDFRLCNGSSTGCGCVDCFKQKLYEKYKEKGEDIMRIAVTYENGEIFQHFGHTEEFKVYDVQDGKVVASEVVNTNGQGHGALAGVLTALKADVLICGGIGGGAQMALAAAGIKLYGGVSGSADAAAVLKLLNHLCAEAGEEPLNTAELLYLGLRIGADVPFCILNGTYRCLGIGEQLLPLAEIPKCYFVVVKPDVGVSTPEAYRACDNVPDGGMRYTPGMVRAVEHRSIEEIANALGNRFDDALQISVVQEVKKYLCENGALNALMTGSGSAVFGIFSEKSLAENAAKRMPKAFGACFLAEPVNG